MVFTKRYVSIGLGVHLTAPRRRIVCSAQHRHQMRSIEFFSRVVCIIMLLLTMLLLTNILCPQTFNTSDMKVVP